MRRLYLTLLFAAHCLVVPAKWGGCRDHPVQDNFTLSSFMGTWFEIEHSTNSESDTRCIMEKFILTKSNRVEILSEHVMEDSSVKIHRKEMLHGEGEKSPAKFYFRFLNEMEWFPMMNQMDMSFMRYWVLTTDYETYSLVYSCQSILGCFHYDSAWIMSRHRNLSTDKIEYLHKILSSNDINIDLLKTNQEKCNVNNL
ncbi:apolipoprotein D-like [Narcine bancroftii]|uniref:apolipoprotein D-like n=1 Tax=Narcine bancroftii TaxID=1343680 RepID=UPI0038318ADF